MNLAVFYNNLTARHKKLEPKINIIANHLIVIFAFSVPLFIQIRRASLFLVLLLFLFRGKYITHIRTALRNPLVLSFALYFAVHVIWLLGTNDSSHASKRVHDASFMLIPLIFSTFIDQRFVSRIFYAFILGMCLSMITSFGLYLEILPPQPFQGSDQGTSINPTPIWNHAIYGFMLVVTAALSLQRVYFDRNIYIKILFITIFLAASFNTILILSRFSYFLYIILIIATFLLLFKKRIIISLTTAIIICTIALLLASNFSDSFSKRIDHTVQSINSVFISNDYSSSLGLRIATYDSAISLIAENYLFGLGTGDDIEATKAKLHEKHPELEEISQQLQHLHNEYLSAFLQFGVIGFIVFLNIIIQFFRNKNNILETKNYSILIGTAIIFISMTEIFVIGLGALLTTVTLSSVILNDYPTRVDNFKRIDAKQVSIYISLFLLFHLYSVLTA